MADVVEVKVAPDARKTPSEGFGVAEGVEANNTFAELPDIPAGATVTLHLSGRFVATIEAQVKWLGDSTWTPLRSWTAPFSVTKNPKDSAGVIVMRKQGSFRLGAVAYTSGTAMCRVQYEVAR